MSRSLRSLTICGCIAVRFLVTMNEICAAAAVSHFTLEENGRNTYLNRVGTLIDNKVKS